MVHYKLQSLNFVLFRYCGNNCVSSYVSHILYLILPCL